MLTISFRTDNAAFDPHPSAEVARILHDVAERIDAGQTDGPAIDANGNRVGQWEMVDHREE